MDSTKDALALPAKLRWNLRNYTACKALCSPPSCQPVLQVASPSLPKATLPAISVDILPEETKNQNWDRTKESSSCQCLEMAGILQLSKEIQRHTRLPLRAWSQTLVTLLYRKQLPERPFTLEEEGAAKDTKASEHHIFHLQEDSKGRRRKWQHTAGSPGRKGC